jgi:hypothetical protein
MNHFGAIGSHKARLAEPFDPIEETLDDERVEHSTHRACIRVVRLNYTSRTVKCQMLNIDG